MSVRNLELMFRPKSVAVIGASDRPHSVGSMVMRNLLAGGYSGAIVPVNAKHDVVGGLHAVHSVASLPAAPDLAVICTPAVTVPGIVAELGARGTRAAVVLTAGLNRGHMDDGRTSQQAMLDAARPYVLRILGPNCVGLLVPGIGLNASFAHASALPGNIAFVSQSGALTTALLDWAKSHAIGFSHFISLGDGADVDFGDALDFLASDPNTRSILLYIESITAARKFMSAARAAARNKPVIVVKAGRVPEGARAAASHTGALAGADDVYDAAIRRAGMLRVETTLELFNAVETLARQKPLHGDRLVIMTNGGGPGVMATDALVRLGGKLAPLSDKARSLLDQVLPDVWSRSNPVDIIGDAPVERYLDALKILIDDAESDAVLLIHAPTAIVPSADIAAAVAPLASRSRKNVLTCWIGGQGVQQGRDVFVAAGVPTFDTPEQAVRAFMHIVSYQRNRELLMEMPPSAPVELKPDRAAAQRIVRDVLAQGRSMLTEPESKALLAAYGVPVVPIYIARDAEEAAQRAIEIGFPVAIKLVSPDISHKSDVGGVVLNLATAEEVRQAAQGIAQRIAELRSGARLTGYSVQPMIRRSGAHELIIGAVVDPIFGPVVLFGQGGTAVEVIADRAVGLPPLNMKLARELVSSTRVAKLLQGYRDRPAADQTAIQLALMSVGQLIADMPEIVELDVNPLLADEHGVLALDARVKVAEATTTGAQRLAIRPYPVELEERRYILGRDVLIRPIRPEDEPAFKRFLAEIAPEDIQFRFFRALREMPRSELARFTQIDYDREMALVAAEVGVPGSILGEVRAVIDPDNERAEFAIMVRSDLKRHGLGHLLMSKIIDYCRAYGTHELYGLVLSANRQMLDLAALLGFRSQFTADYGVVEVRLELRPRTQAAST
ncbi:MAG: GNAT family N-acetyltransferase [Rhodospirillaceae bacterium]